MSSITTAISSLGRDHIILLTILTIVLAPIIHYLITLIREMINGRKKAPYVPSFDGQLQTLTDSLTISPDAHILDLGCGDGKVLRRMHKRFGCRGTGVERSRQVTQIGRLFNWIAGTSAHCQIINGTFESVSAADIQRYEIIYLYLRPSQMLSLESRIIDAIRDDAIIISNSFQFGRKADHQIGTKHYRFYLYSKNGTGLPDTGLYTLSTPEISPTDG